MPCHDPGPDAWSQAKARQLESDVLNLQAQKEMVEAMLCGVLRANPHSFESVDWQQVGVPLENAQAWWDEHQRRDAQRRAQEEALAEVKEQEEREQLAYLKEKYDNNQG